MAAAQPRSTVVGVFEDRAQADRAVAELKKAGFSNDQIGVASRHADGDAFDHDEEHGNHAESGAVTGVLTGLGLGALAGLGVLSGVIPVIGPAIAAGTLGVILSNAAAGAAVAGLAGALIGAGIPEDEANYYHGEFEAGRTIVTVQAESRAAEAASILRGAGAYNMESRGTAVGTAVGAPVGKKVSKSAATVVEAPAATPVSKASSRAKAGDAIEVKEERLHAEKTPVEAGEVRIRKEVRTETQHIEVPVEREEVVIERTPVRGKATTDVIREGEEIRIPVREEKVRVTKDAVVTEEVKVGKRTVHDTEHVSGQVRKEEVKVETEGDVDVKTRGTAKKK